MSDLLEYKNYLGSVEYSAEDKVFYGQLLHIRSLINYEGTDADSLESAFREAVDDYLETCKAEEIKPEIPFRGGFNVRVGTLIHRRAALQAREMGLNLNQYVSMVLDYCTRLNMDVVKERPMMAACMQDKNVDPTIREWVSDKVEGKGKKKNPLRKRTRKGSSEQKVTRT